MTTAFNNLNQTITNTMMDQTTSNIASRRCIADIQDSKQISLANNKAMEAYTFDYVASEEVSQDEIFQSVGKPIVD
jgi:hypothetical protein